MNADKNDYSTIIKIKFIENRKNEFCFEFFDKSNFWDKEIYLYNENGNKDVKNRVLKVKTAQKRHTLRQYRYSIRYIEIIF